MPLRTRNRARRLPRAAEAGGFTLVETLVAMVTGIVIVGAAFAILEVALHQSTRLVDVAQATQLGRTTMTRIVDELHTACIAPKFATIREGSNEKELIFVDAYSESAKIASAREDRIVFEPGSGTGGTLTDFSYPSTAESEWPNFTFSATASPAGGTRIGENVSQSENAVKEKIPVFQYYKYAEKSATSTTEASSTLNELAPVKGKEGPKGGLTAKEAETVAGVLVSFRIAPASNSSQADRSLDVRDQVTLTYDAPNSEATIKEGPCE